MSKMEHWKIGANYGNIGRRPAPLPPAATDCNKNVIGSKFKRKYRLLKSKCHKAVIFLEACITSSKFDDDVIDVLTTFRLLYLIRLIIIF